MKYKKKYKLGTKDRPRLSVFRSNNALYVQLIDDISGNTLASASSLKYDSGQNKETAVKLGENIVLEANKINVKKVIFDRGSHRYEGNIKLFAESARKSGLEF